jgi:DHA1 family inner membrane transport protein
MPTGIPGTSYGLGILETGGWIGHNGSIPGYETVTVYLPSQKSTMVLTLNTDISYEGQEPSTLLARAVTKTVTPDNVYDGSVTPRQESTSCPSARTKSGRGRGDRGPVARPGPPGPRPSPLSVAPDDGAMNLQPVAHTRRMPAGLLALALGSFGIGLTEFVIAGLLPQVGRDLAVSEAAAGWLISGYALTVAVGAVLVTAATARLPRKAVLVGLVALFVVGNLLSAVAPTYPVMLLGRVVAALCHGSFFGIGSLVARRMVAPERASRAVAVMFGGLTLANVLGVPFGALVGERWGWRATFWAITGIGVLAAVALAVLVPRWAGDADTARPGDTSATVAGRPDGPRTQLRAFRSRQVWLTLTATALGYGGMFGAFTYLAYTFTRVSGFSSTDVAWLLVVYGSGLVAGNLVGGRAADRDRDLTLIVSLAGLAVTLTLFGLLATSPVASVILVFVTGLFGFAGVPGFITRVTDHAHGVPLAASANVSASNVGNALGAWLGGLAIGGGLGYTAPLYVGAGIVLSGLAVMVAAARDSGRARAEVRGAGPARDRASAGRQL